MLSQLSKAHSKQDFGIEFGYNKQQNKIVFLSVRFGNNTPSKCDFTGEYEYIGEITKAMTEKQIRTMIKNKLG